MKRITTLILMLFFFNSYAQINENYDFESDELPAGWDTDEFFTTSDWDFPCDGISLLTNLYQYDFGDFIFGLTSAYVETEDYINLGAPITLGFDIRISDAWEDPTPVSGIDFGNVYVEFSLDGGSVWVQHSVINSGNFTFDADGCTRYTTTIPEMNLQNSDNVKFRLRFQTANSGTYEFLIYIDNVTIVQAELNNCKNPINIAVRDVTSTSALFSWQAPLSSDPITSYQYEVRTSGLAGSGAAGLISEGTTTALQKLIDNLQPNKNHYFYIKSICGAGSARNWLALAEFRTPCAILPNLVAENQNFCGTTGLVSDIVAVPHESASIMWYDSPTSFVNLDPTASLTSRTYYGAYFLNGCYSTTRTPVVVTLKTKPRAPRIDNQFFCGATVVSDIDLSPAENLQLRWYASNRVEIDPNTVLGSGTYYVSQYDEFCESTLTAFQVSVSSLPIAPIVEDQTYCGNATIASIPVQGVEGAVFNWYANSTSTTTLPQNTPLSTGSYYVSQSVARCESVRVVVNITAYSSVPMPISQNQNFCSANVQISDLVISGINGAAIRWYDTPSDINPLDPNTIVRSKAYYASQKLGECESEKTRIIVNVSANLGAPQIATQYFCEPAVVSDLRVNLADDMQAKWYRNSEFGQALPGEIALESGTYYVTQGKFGCESPRTAFEVIVNPKPNSPTGETSQSVVEGSTIANLVVSAVNPVWYGSLIDLEAKRNQLAPESAVYDNFIYYVVNESEAGCASSPLAIKVTLTLGINDFDLKSLSYFPNPTSDWVTIAYKEIITSYEIYDNNGKRIGKYSNADNQAKIDLSALAAGVYHIQLNTDKHHQTVKIIKK